METPTLRRPHMETEHGAAGLGQATSSAGLGGNGTCTNSQRTPLMLAMGIPSLNMEANRQWAEINQERRTCPSYDFLCVL